MQTIISSFIKPNIIILLITITSCTRFVETSSNEEVQPTFKKVFELSSFPDTTLLLTEMQGTTVILEKRNYTYVEGFDIVSKREGLNNGIAASFSLSPDGFNIEILSQYRSGQPTGTWYYFSFDEESGNVFLAASAYLIGPNEMFKEKRCSLQCFVREFMPDGTLHAKGWQLQDNIESIFGWENIPVGEWQYYDHGQLVEKRTYDYIQGKCYIKYFKIVNFIVKKNWRLCKYLT